MKALLILLALYSIGCAAKQTEATAINTKAENKIPWAFNAPEAEGYSIRLVSSSPVPGTPVTAGTKITVKVTGTYSMTIAKQGTIILVPQDDRNRPLGEPGKQVKLDVSAPQGTFELTQIIDVPENAKEIRLFVPLVPQKMIETTGEIIIRYPVVDATKLAK